MSKKAIVAFLLVAPLSILSAQLNVGAKGGVNIASWIAPTNPPLPTKWSSIVRATAGAFVNYEFGILGVQLESNLIQKGLHGSYYTVVADLTINMLEFPLLLRVNVPLEPLKPYLLAGVAYGIVLSARSQGTDSHSTFDDDYKEYLRDDEVSALATIGAEYSITQQLGLVLQVSYSVGLRTIEASTSTKPRNRGIQIQAGVVTSIL